MPTTLRKMTDPVTALLQAARRRIADPARWTHGVQARDADGCGVDPLDDDAVAWCAAGALRREAAEEDAHLFNLRGAAYQRLYAVTGRSVEDVNDAQGHATVLALFDAAIRGK